jgi:DNA-binding MarR family transcriptional regulator
MWFEISVVQMSPRLVSEAAGFAEVLGKVWELATTTSRSRGSLPVLAPSQARALHAITRRPGITPAELADEMRMSRSLISELVRKLEQQRLIARTRSEVDGRSITLNTTERGAYVQDHFHLGLVNALAEAFGAMQHADVELLLEAMPALSGLRDRLESLATQVEAAVADRRPSE